MAGMATNPGGGGGYEHNMAGAGGGGGYMTNPGAGGYGDQPGATQPFLGAGGGFMTGGGPAQQQGGQGGYAAGAGGYAAGMGGMAAMGGAEGFATIEKQVRWRFLFFGGACCTLAAGVIATLYFVFNFFNASSWSPCTFISALFLSVFGLMMMVLDLPSPMPQLQVFRDAVYKFALFMTRFTGRGVWYVFLGTHAWVALYDCGVATWLAPLLTLYLVLLGGAALAKGWMLSSKLQQVRQTLLDSHQGVEKYMETSRGYMDKEQFHHMVTSCTSDLFNEDELSYVMGALSFRPDHRDQLLLEELNYWLQPGSWTYV